MIDRYMVSRLIDLWLAEDIGSGDLTSQTMIDADARATFDMNARQAMIVAGVEVAGAVFKHYDPAIEVAIKVADGDRAAPKTVLLRVSGPARSLLTAERAALNIVQHLSGIATETARYVEVIAGTRAKLIDTRKTTPGLRMLEKHAVVCGGGSSHRLGLDGGIMIKDNHIAISGSITAAVARARAGAPLLTKIEVECDRLDQVREALAVRADVIMLDNMSLADMREAVRLVDGRIPIEASGGVRFDTIRGIAETGVDFISTSKITQAAPAVDIGLDDAA
ncbi:MAG TPA: carboxylating nicotinate-nucleotide diphosphorylase [Xanthobacteraceae bacterium]|jgi:nicotinate-nucleotide pyrophosphorylase (carboxylating)|nr:carboxylating nicotinate-nucleotide diphosphorylase [Xanthobacteraceae bacterium]